MIGLFLLLSAQAVAAAPADAPPPASPPARRVCRKAPGSDTIVCKAAPQQQSQLLQKPPPQAYGPAAPNAQPGRGNGVKIRAQASNKGRRNRAMATVGIPF